MSGSRRDDALGGYLKAGAANLAGLVFRALATKIFALYVGPSGIALFGFVRQIIDISHLIASAGGGSAVIQGVSSADGEAQNRYIRSVAIAYLGGAVIVAASLLLFGRPLIAWLAGDVAPDLVPVMPLIALVVLVTCVSSFSSSVANGQGHYDLVVLSAFLGSLALAALAYPTALWAAGGDLGFYVITQTIPPLIGLALTIRYVHPLAWFGRGGGAATTGPIDLAAIRRFYDLSLWLLAVNVATAAGQFAIRIILLDLSDLATLGQYTAAIQLNTILFTLLTASAGVYQLPSLSRAADGPERAGLQARFLSITALASAILVTLILPAKVLLIQILYSGRFLDALTYLDWMLPAVLFQALISILRISLIATRRGFGLFLTEFVQNSGFAAACLVTLYWSGSAKSVGMIYFAAQIVTLLVGITLIEPSLGRALVADRTARRAVLGSSAVVGIVLAATLGQRSAWNPGGLALALGLCAMLVAVAGRRERAALAALIPGRWRRSRPVAGSSGGE